MGTRMLYLGGEEHMHRGVPSSWGGMHSESGAVESGGWQQYSSGSPGSSGGNTWSKRLQASGASSNEDSWEVRAFAEDASTSGQWPPRSYSCSFCQREFRTAQALGGHMNVHRRERAQANQLAQLRNSTPASTETNAAAPWAHHQQASSTDHYRAYSPVRSHHPSPYESNWRQYDPAPRHHHHHDSGLDLELRLGQRYD